MTTATAPRRVQRQRTRGWTAPLDHLGRKPVYVGRGTPYGNPWIITQDNHRNWIVMWDGTRQQALPRGLNTFTPADDRRDAHATAVRLYREHLDAHPELVERARRDLAGRDLMCWCALKPVRLPCHVDVLLSLVNG